jgi:hypothetical protein
LQSTHKKAIANLNKFAIEQKVEALVDAKKRCIRTYGGDTAFICETAYDEHVKQLRKEQENG